MTTQRHATRYLPILCMLLVMTTFALAVRAPTRPLEERVREAEIIFVGTVAEKVVDGDWVRADLVVEDPLKNAERGAKVAVIWRATLGGRPIYDTAEGTRAIAILKDKHEGRYWLRDDKFEDAAQLAEVKKWIETKD